jgi:hypothetical protein
MPEAIGTAAAVLQLAETSAKASLMLYQLFLTVKNAPKEIANLSRDIKNFNVLVGNSERALASSNVQMIVNQDPQINRAFEDLREPMRSCQEVCDRVMRRLGPHLEIEDFVDNSHNSSEVPSNGTGASTTKRSPKRRIRSDFAWFLR